MPTTSHMRSMGSTAGLGAATVVLVLTPDQEIAVALLITDASAESGATMSTSAGWWARLVHRWTNRTRSARDRDSAAGARRSGTRWEDSASCERPGWTARSAYVAGSTEPVFEVDVEVCTDCGIGWVEQPYTPPPFQRHGLATAGLASLRRDHPEAKSWHTLGDHLSDSDRLWAAAGAGMPGGYQQRDLCEHLDR